MTSIGNSKNVVREMLSQRSYSIVDEGYDESSEEKYYVITAKKCNGSIVKVFFTNIDKFNTECVQYFTKKLHSLAITHCIILYNNSITSSANKMILNIPVLSSTISKDTKLKKIQLEMFKYDELQFNITKHELQPSFRALTNKESNIFKKKYGSKFPKFLPTDPIVKFYNFQAGSVIEITRNNGYITYRIVKRS
jgi:DNA-directed RNA polymerase subunit H (RpoH/RPB5)